MKDCRDQTVRVLKNLLAGVEKRHYPISFALELNRCKGKVDPSTTYAGVLDICRETGDERVGICWDWGHAQANVRNRGLRPEPPAEFIRRVINVHVHALGPDGRTHWPLAGPSAAIKTALYRLKNLRYSGYLILELHPRRFAHQLDLKKAARISVSSLEEAILGVYDGARTEETV